MDHNLGQDYDKEEVEMVIQIALLCTQASPEDRPSMSEVVRMLEGEGLAERWEEWQQAEVTRGWPYDYGWSEDSHYKLEAIQLSGAR